MKTKSTSPRSRPSRRQGRILRLHFACSAPLPVGTTLRVTSSIGPPPRDDVPTGEDDDDPLASADDASSVGGGVEGSAGGGGGDDGLANKSRVAARLLQNTVEMYTTPETYPIWKTRRPVVVIDDGGAEGGNEGDAAGSLVESSLVGEKKEAGPLLHRYRYVAVTPGAAIDWSLCSRREHPSDMDDRSRGSASTGRDKATAATTPPGSDDEDDHHHDEEGKAEEGCSRGNHRSSTPSSVEDAAEGSRVLHYGSSHDEEDDDDDAEGEDEDFPPVQFENPSPPAAMAEDLAEEVDDSKKKRRSHRRVHSLFDEHGNPVTLLGGPIAPEPSAPSLAGTSAISLASTAVSINARKIPPLLTWEGVDALPYRARVVGGSDPPQDPSDIPGGATDVQIVDHWNDGNDPAFKTYWEAKKNEVQKAREGAMKDTTVTQQSDARDAQPPNEDDDPMDAADENTQKESIFIVCYHLPVTLTRDPATSEWKAHWSESLIAKSELHGVSSTRKTTWIGTVSNVPTALQRSPIEREAIRRVLEGMDCIPVFFDGDGGDGEDGGAGGGGGGDGRSLQDLMYLGFCKQVLWPSFHNVDLLDLATNGWGQRQKNTSRSDPVAACALAAAEAKERKRSGSVISMTGGADTDEEGRVLRSDWDQRRLDRWWDAYIRVNRKFSRVVADLVMGGDIVWVHDYHLALMPRMLREARGEPNVVGAGKDLSRKTFVGGGGRSAVVEQAMRELAMVEDRGEQWDAPVRMVFFIHVPFPTSQVFRELEHGEALLEGMLHADVVGFHAFDHARHFLNAAKRILGLTYESLVGGLIGVRHRGTKVLVTVSNVSVEADIIDALLEYPSVKEKAAAIRRKHFGRTIISDISVAQRLTGVSYKLLAFERLLSDYPVWQSKVVLLQRCLVPGARRLDEADTLREVRTLVRRIADRFGPEVIDYEDQPGSVLPVDDRLAIWTTSSIMMHAPIREGLNLCPLEFVYAHKEPAEPGVVISSEFSAVGSILNGALRVNPYDVQQCVTCIDAALSMSHEERDARRGRDIDFVSTCPSGLWTRNVLRDLNDATLGGGPASAASAVMEDGPKAGGHGLERLDLPALSRAYASASTRVIIIDFNGTLVVKEPAGKYLKREILGTSGFKPTHVSTLALRRLCADPRNTVYVVSGDSQPNLEAAVGNVPGLGLAASNGTCFADPCLGKERSWRYLDFGIDWNAVKKVAMPIISKFTARTNGSFVKLSHSSIGWSYYSCDPEWGSLQASHLVTELGEALRAFDVRFVALKGIVEVVPRKGHKGHIVKQVLESVRARSGEVDFVLCMGDDISDEKMFMSVTNFSAGSTGDDSYAFNVAVGKKTTSASFYVDDASDVSDILVALSGDKRLLDHKVSLDESAAASDDFFA